MPRAPALLIPLMLAATPVAAQEAAPGQAAGLRYLSWTGRTAAPVPARRDASAARADLRRPNAPIPHGGFARTEAPAASRLTPAPGSVPGRLTPANAWMRRAAPPAAIEAPPPPPSPPVVEAAETERVDPTPVARMEPPRELLPPGYPDYLPSRGGRQQAVPQTVLAPVQPQGQPVYGDGSGEAAPAQPADPMAPRRDAPIFRLSRPASTEAPPAAPVAEAPRAEAAPAERVAVVTQNPADRPPQQGARYYSVHRQNGRTPDALAMPEPTYVDALAVTLAETPASQDLAQPERGPALIRDVNGRVRAAPAASDGDHQ